MEENEFYMTVADSIYGMSRKCFIYVTKVCNKVFFYKYIDDWQLIEVDGITKLKINEQGTGNWRGKLEDRDAFRKLKRTNYILGVSDEII